MTRSDTQFRDALIVHEHVKKRKTLSAIAEIAKLSRERVRQIVRAAGVDVAVTQEVLEEQGFRGSEVTITCGHCGGTVTKPKHGAGKGLFCSKVCANAKRRRSDDELLTILRQMALTLGRTPRTRDFGGEWPHHGAYYTRFGSLLAAQKLAGLTPTRRGGHAHQHDHALPDVFREEWGHLLEEVST